jgi:hypothetical protein
MRSVQVLEPAALEAEAAARWYEDQRAGLGGEFREAFKAALDTLGGGLVSGSPWPGPLGERGVKRIRVKRFPFHIVFVAPGITSVVIAVAHYRRRPGYWRDRLRLTAS